MREIRMLRSTRRGWKRSHGWVYTGTNGDPGNRASSRPYLARGRGGQLPRPTLQTPFRKARSQSGKGSVGWLDFAEASLYDDLE